MQKPILAALLLFTISTKSYSQTEVWDSTKLILLNKLIDSYVVNQDTLALKDIYGDDFVFSHGSGRVDNKESWMRSVAKGGFLMRYHDSVTVELHGLVGIVKGKLTVQKKNKEKVDRYFLKYIRVFIKRKKKWEFVSHSTFFEQHEP